MRAFPEGLRTTGRNRRGKRARPGARIPRLLQFEPLEDRTLLTITPSIPLANAAPGWTDLGPQPILNGQVTGMPLQNNPVAGSVIAFATAPASAAVGAATVAFAATAGGGVWETNNLNATTAVDLNQVSNVIPVVAPPSPGGGPSGGGAAVTGPFNYVLTYLFGGGLESRRKPLRRP